MRMKILALVICLMVWIPTGCSSQYIDRNGTTKNIDMIFIGRCVDYQEIRYKGILPSVSTPCLTLWMSFAAAFQYRPPCDLTMARYQTFIQESKQELPRDKVVFWSGVSDISQEYSNSGHRFITLEDTLMGYVVNSLQWCGQTFDSGINFNVCPPWTGCSQEASESYWAAASIMFASQARGNVTVILDGSNPDMAAYRRDSFFGKYELPNLSQDYVTVVRVLVVHRLDSKAMINNCTSENIRMLESDLSARGFPMTCVDNPDLIMFILCSEDPTSSQCRLVQNIMVKTLPPTLKSTPYFNQNPHYLGM